MSEKPSAKYWEARCNEWMGECDRIRQQRDEARAERDEARQLFGEALADAEARGFERGAREAADKLRSMGTSTTGYAAQAILALLEPVTLQKPEA
jgi:hypothetical protein